MNASKPPLLARALLRLLPVGDRRGEITADLCEAFERRCDQHGRGMARRRYLRDVLSVAVRLPQQWSRPQPSRWLADAAADTGYAVRVFRRQAGAVSIVVAGLAVAIAVCTAVFSLVNAVILRPYGMVNPDDVFRVTRAYDNGISTSWTYADFLRIRGAASQMDVHATLFDTASVAESADAIQPAAEPLSYASVGYLEMLGGRALHGRLLGAADASTGSAAAAVVNHRFWEQRFKSDAGVVGRTVWIAGAPVTIVGVLDRGITGATDRPPAFYLPFASYEAIYRAPRTFSPASTTGVTVFARLSPGVTADRAQAEMRGLSPMLQAVPAAATDGGPVIGLYPRLDPADDRFAGPQAMMIRAAVAVVLVVIGLVLLLACANVANLQLAIAIGRRREFAMRLALGARRGRLIRQVIVESVLIGLAGGALGYLLTLWTLPWLSAWSLVPASFDVAPDIRVYTFLVIASVLAGLGAGLAPARLASRADTAVSANGRVVRDHQQQPSRLRSWLVGGQAAASILLLILAALMTRATQHLATIDLGFEPGGLVAVSADFPRSEQGKASAQRYFAEAPQRARAVPGVGSVALAIYAPFGGATEVMQRKRADGPLVAHFNYTSANYFDVIGQRIVNGRGYTAAEAASGERVAVITANLARRLFGDESPIGKPLSALSEKDIVIGVAADAMTAGLRDNDAATVYRPFPADRLNEAQLVVRSSVSTVVLLRPLERAMRTIDPDVRTSATSVSDSVEGSLREPRALAAVSTAIGTVALALAVIGLYGVTTLSVGQRTREIGVRMAIGATTSDVRRLLVRDNLRPVAIGLTAGVAVAVFAMQIIASGLHGVSARDPWAMGAAIAVLTIAATLATAIPAQRVAKIDPVRTLRSE